MGQRIVWVSKGVTRLWVWDLVWKRWGCNRGEMAVGAAMEGTIPGLGK